MILGVNLPQISKIMQDFAQESEMMDMKQELINDAIDDAVEEDDEEQETNDILNQVLDEIVIVLNQSVFNLDTFFILFLVTSRSFWETRYIECSCDQTIC